MAEKSNIEWTDATWNPITGCSIKSTGCERCYAMKLAATRLRNHPSRHGLTKDSKTGPVWNGEVRFNEGWLLQPLQWCRPRMIFVCAHGDLFHENVPDEWIDRVFAVMALASHHAFQVLTKRSDRMRVYMSHPERETIWMNAVAELLNKYPALLGRCYSILGRREPWLPLPNVWLGVSAERQQEYDLRKDDLRNTPAAVHFFSFEPLLGPINADYLGDWAIVGGESGDGARPMHPDWVRMLERPCFIAGVPFFFKQWGEWVPQFGAIDLYESEEVSRRQWVAWDGKEWDYWDKPAWCDDVGAPEDCLVKVGKKAAGRLLDGVEHNGMPRSAA